MQTSFGESRYRGTLLPSKPEVIKQTLHGGRCHIASESLRSRIHQFTGIMIWGQLLTAFRDKEKWVDTDEETIGNMGVGILDRVMKELQNGMFVNRPQVGVFSGTRSSYHH